MIKSISITWTDEDVKQQADDMGVELTDTQVSDILTRMESNHDATIGINWDVIAYHINEAIEEA